MIAAAQADLIEGRDQSDRPRAQSHADERQEERIFAADQSPSQPNTNAPNGRTRNPAVNSAIVLSRAATGWLFSKNLTDKIAAKLPNI